MTKMASYSTSTTAALSAVVFVILVLNPVQSFQTTSRTTLQSWLTSSSARTGAANRSSLVMVSEKKTPDWREARARLSAGSSENWEIQLERNQNREMRGVKVWAHDVYNPEPGALVLSSPYSKKDDTNIFRDQGVAVITSNSDKNGCTGVFLNQPTRLKVQDITDDLPEFRKNTVYCGGLENKGQVMVIHGVPGLPRARPVCPGLWQGGDLKFAAMLVRSGQAMPGDFKFVTQTYEWPSGYLEFELAIGMWQLAATNVEIVTKSAVNLEVPLWREVMGLLGGVHELRARDQYGQI
mmetsp:Transcript_9090/g.14747  ORF Transcript_9090/g.14747 Transcript_9090/m.14747 type:complete len:295 (+) Transcript_9090:119-1003(+)